MNEELQKELVEISKGKWFGLPYGSFHHPGFMVDKAQRNTAERFEKIGITKHLFNAKILDLGCNTGAMLAYAMQMGAGYAVGIDNDAKAIEFDKKLFDYLKFRSLFAFEDVNKLNDISYHQADIVFCFALSKWVNYDHLIKLLSESEAPLIFFEDNQHMGKIIPDIIPGYDCKFVWFSGPEANTDKGWQRVNYVCWKK
jgi:ribosomal protein L11 methylase PrmA